MENKDKTCKLCGLNKRGFSSVQICKECKNKVILEREARARLKPTKEEFLERKRLRRKKQKKLYKQRHRDKVLAEKKRYRERHKEELNKKLRIYIESNKEHFLELKRKWKKTSNGKFSKKIEKFKRRNKEKRVIHSFTKEQWKTKVQSVNEICPICNHPFDKRLRMLTLDHTPPISKAQIGFVYTIDNVSPMCASCNSKKRDKE